jgi:hypothetical protein
MTHLPEALLETAQFKAVCETLLMPSPKCVEGPFRLLQLDQHPFDRCHVVQPRRTQLLVTRLGIHLTHVSQQRQSFAYRNSKVLLQRVASVIDG